jgi:beta-glucanase (GH16 family)
MRLMKYHSPFAVIALLLLTGALNDRSKPAAKNISKLRYPAGPGSIDVKNSRIWHRFVLLVTLSIGCTSSHLIGQAPTLYEKLTPPDGSSSQTGTAGLTTADGAFQVDGPWTGTGGNELLPSLAVFTTADPTTLGQPATGYLTLSISPGTPLQGSEIISTALPGYGYGYYEVMMAVDPTQVSGGVCSFFLMQAGGTSTNKTYGPGEFDFEFLLNESWLKSTSSGAVHLTTHPSNVSVTQGLSFNPALGYHRYGFLWVSGKLSFTVDGQVVHTTTSSDVALPPDGEWIFANAWSGDSTWGGGPPVAPVNCVYNWIKFWPNATSVPNEGPNPPTGLTAVVR